MVVGTFSEFCKCCHHCVCGVRVSNIARMSGPGCATQRAGLHHTHGSRLYAGRVSLCALCRLGVPLQCRLLHHTQTPRHQPRNPGERRLTKVLSSSWTYTYRHSHTYFIRGTLHNLQLFTGLILFMTWILFIRG